MEQLGDRTFELGQTRVDLDHLVRTDRVHWVDVGALASTEFLALGRRAGSDRRSTYLPLRTAYNCHSPGTPFNSWRPRSAN